jgi:hypothetical protein
LTAAEYRLTREALRGVPNVMVVSAWKGDCDPKGITLDRKKISTLKTILIDVPGMIEEVELIEDLRQY